MAGSRTAWFLARIWFRALRQEGPALPEGPCLILLNHPNGLLDPLAAAALLDRRAGWLAKATLWKIAPLRPFLAAFRAIPVTRPKDGGATRASILESFRKVHQVLAAGGSVAMFPEGVSHTHADLEPLKTGAARIALSCPVPLSVVPAGLVYGDRGRFRHSVLLRLGEPVSFGDLTGPGPEPGAESGAGAGAESGAESGAGLGREAVAELTARIRAALQPLTLHGADERALALAQDIAWLLAEAPGSRVDLEALRGRVQTLLPRLAALGKLEVAALEARVHGAQAWLRAKGLRPDQVGHPYAGSDIREWMPGAALRLAMAALVLVPSLLFWPPYRLAGGIAARFSDEGDLTATLKLISGLLLHPLWALFLSGLAGWYWSWNWGLALLPLAALLVAILGHPLLERAAEDVQAARGFLRRRDPAMPELLEARRQLLEAFPELKA